jgi:hypothetical protein
LKWRRNKQCVLAIDSLFLKYASTANAWCTAVQCSMLAECLCPPDSLQHVYSRITHSLFLFKVFKIFHFLWLAFYIHTYTHICNYTRIYKSRNEP